MDQSRAFCDVRSQISDPISVTHPAGKYTTAGATVFSLQVPGAHRPPELIARLMAAVSS